MKYNSVLDFYYQYLPRYFHIVLVICVRLLGGQCRLGYGGRIARMSNIRLSVGTLEKSPACYLGNGAALLLECAHNVTPGR